MFKNSPKQIPKEMITFSNTTQQPQIAVRNRHGVGVQQNHVVDDPEPGHVPLTEIMKVNKIEQQQSGFMRPPSSQNIKIKEISINAGHSPPPQNFQNNMA